MQRSKARRAEILKRSVSLAGNVARVALGIPGVMTVPTKSAEKQTIVSACNETTLASLAERKKLLEDIKTIESDAAKIKAQVALLSARLVNGRVTAPGSLDEFEGEALALQSRLGNEKRRPWRKLNEFLSVRGVGETAGQRQRQTKLHLGTGAEQEKDQKADRGYRFGKLQGRRVLHAGEAGEPVHRQRQSCRRGGRHRV